MSRFVAVLSSTVLTDGTFECKEVSFPSAEELAGVPHYVGHPATKGLLEALGAIAAPSKLFGGLAVGESYLAVPLATSPRAEGEAWTRDVAISSVSELKAKRVTRLS